MKKERSLFQKIPQIIIGMMFVSVGIAYMIYTAYSPAGFISVFFGTGFGIMNITTGVFE